jgi:hypothetical protein
MNHIRTFIPYVSHFAFLSQLNTLLLNSIAGSDECSCRDRLEEYLAKMGCLSRCSTIPELPPKRLLSPAVRSGIGAVSESLRSIGGASPAPRIQLIYRKGRADEPTRTADLLIAMERVWSLGY